MLRETPNTEAVIVEYGFLDNANDAAKLKANYQDYAEAVVRAVTEYKGLNYIPPAGSGQYYTVKAGDTLWTIANKNGLSVDELKSINNLTSNALSIGQTLKLSANGTTIEPEAPQDNIYHTVVRGDTLYALARRYNTTVSEIKRLNNLSNNNLTIGQRLLVRIGTTPSGSNTYTVKSGDTLYAIANKYGTTVDAIKQANDLTSNNLSIGQALTIPESTQYKTYTVVRGDTLYGIAIKNGTTVDAIKKLNNLSTNLLSIGQKLLIP